jgi:hypothetical protein
VLLAYHTIITTTTTTTTITTAFRDADLFLFKFDNPRALSKETFKNLVKDFILSRPWYGRIWVLQELVLSAKPLVQCGKN